MKLTFRYYLGAGLLAAAAFAGCSAIERGISQFERGFDDEPPASGLLPGVYAESLTDGESIGTPTPVADSVQAPAPLNTQGRDPRPTEFLIEPLEDVPALVPPPAPAPLPLNGQPAAFRGNAGQIRPICFNSSSCCPSVVSCDPCSTSCCSSGCGESLLSKMHRGISNVHGRMYCFKSRVKSKLSRLNPFSCSSGCDPCATCCDPCASCCVPSCCDPCGDGVILDGVVVGSYPASSGSYYGGQAQGFPQYSQPAYQGVYAPQAQGVYGSQAPCNCQQGARWQPQQQQFTQAQTWQQYAPQQQQYAAPHQYAPQQYAQPHYQGQPTYAPQQQQQYAAPQYQQQHPQQYSQPVQPNTQIPGLIQNPQPGAIQHEPIQQGNLQPPVPVSPAPAASQTPGTALLGPGYAPRSIPVTRHLQTTYVTVR